MSLRWTRMVVGAGTLALVLARAGGASAQQPQNQAELVLPAGGAAGNLTVVTSGQIEATAAPDLKAALALQPDLLFDDSGGTAGQATLSLRGSTPQQVLVLIDGHRIANARSSLFSLNDLPLMIERIERVDLLPAPASALYGADALGGVLNIVTRPPGTQPAFTVAIGGGSQSEERATGGAQYGIGKVGLRFDSQLRTGDGYRANGDYDLQVFSLGATLPPAPWGLDLRWNALERKAGVPGPTAFPSPNARQQDSRSTLRADCTYRPGRDWDVRTGVFSEHQTLRFEDPDPPDFDPEAPAAAIDSRYENRARGADFQWDFATGRGEIFTIGGEWVNDRLAGASDGEHETESWGVYAQDQWGQGGWSLVGAVRRDQHSVYGDKTTPSLSLGWEAGGWKLWGSWAQGYRTPNFRDLYGNERFFQGNPDLKPETAESYEGGLEFGGSGGLVRICAFRRNVRNLIRWADADAYSVRRMENLARARFSGWETGIVYRPAPAIIVPIGYQQLSTEDEATGEQLSGAVRSLWRAAIQSTEGSFGWSLEYALTDRGRFRLRDEAWRYGVVNAAFTWKGTMGSLPLRLSLRGDNLQDRRYETVEGYPMPGRAFFLEAQVGL